MSIINSVELKGIKKIDVNTIKAISDIVKNMEMVDIFEEPKSCGDCKNIIKGMKHNCVTCGPEFKNFRKMESGDE
jgi:hypothetical protein